jgi:hypothetical protein
MARITKEFFFDRKPVDEDTVDMAYGGFEIMYENLTASNECKKKSLSPNVHNVRLHSYEH